MIVTAPPKTILKPEDNLLECGCVPSAMIHFSCNTEIDYLKPELKEKIVSGCQASIAAYLVRYYNRSKQIIKRVNNIYIYFENYYLTLRFSYF